ncbi:MAG: hypothetical protein HKN35_13255 [Woeseia sp.]|nr:hypothetical protein [Woeseia sp.]
MLIPIVYTIALAAGLAILGLSFATLLRPKLRFWPPPKPGGWQQATFRALFRVFFLGLLVLSVVSFETRSLGWRTGLGLALLLVGFGFATRWTIFLGWRNAFGEPRGLKTNGAWGWSRNPIYVVSVVGMTGWGLVLGSWLVASLLLLWACFYIIAPFLEEPWLEQHYGDAFLLYKRNVPRFVGWL